MLRNACIAVCLFLSIYTYSQTTISGIITNENQEPLPGATVLLTPGSKGTTTSANGSYTMDMVSKGNYELKVSYLGYKEKTKSITVSQEPVIIDFSLEISSILAEEVIVRSTRAGKTTPTTYSVVSKKEIGKNNLGQDIPYLLGMEPGLVTSSDAGAGIGYTGMWIRGSNIQRINVTVNGIPLNDPESHGVFWVNMPDFSNSVESAQIQRGVGTSTNGSGAFGANINLATNLMEQDAFASFSGTYGSFNTYRANVEFGTGLLDNNFAFEGRVSRIHSDGYIDYSSSNLQSMFLQGGYFGNKTSIKAVVFTGKEITQQAWNGVDQLTLDNDRTFNSAATIYDPNWNALGIYDNEIDHYQQDHYQLHFNHQFNHNLDLSLSAHYTYGRGYYEQFNGKDSLKYYPMGEQYFAYNQLTGVYGDTVHVSDLIVRRWLNNHFYGTTYALNYNIDKLNINFGGAINRYAPAKHFGEIIWAEFAGTVDIRDKYYNNQSQKNDVNNYFKVNYNVLGQVSLFADLQLRYVEYIASGTDKGGAAIGIDKQYVFFNPKFGLTYNNAVLGNIYASFAHTSREPIRTDFIDAPLGVEPSPEKLSNIEAGLRKADANYAYNANVYYMHYTNQLALTGELNDVGSPIRKNIGKSDRYGIEIDGGYKPNKYVGFRANFTYNISSTDYKANTNGEIVTYQNVTLAYSPMVVSAHELNVYPVKGLEISLLGKYVGRTYLDNTETVALSLDPYYINNIRVGYSLETKKIKTINISLLANNVANVKYSSNGYTWYGYAYYYPQAGRNYLVSLTVVL